MNRVGFFSWNRLVEARTTAKKRREREKEKRDSWKRTDNDMRSTRRALPSPWKKFSRRWPPTIHIIRGKSCTSHILSLSLSLWPVSDWRENNDGTNYHGCSIG